MHLLRTDGGMNLDAYCQTCGYHLEECQCPHAPELAALLVEIAETIGQYVVLTSDQLAAVALWVAHTWAIEAADATPYLAVTSPEKRSGKTRLLEVLEFLVPKPLRASSISEAALFRIVADTEEGRSAILLDEADALFNPKTNHEDLRKLVNAGYRRGAVAVRCEAIGKTQVVRTYDAFSAKVIAGIGKLPETIADRSIPIAMHKRARHEVVARFRTREVAQLTGSIRSALNAWAVTDTNILQDARPHLPDELDDRAQDGWEPLLAIADLAGGGWSTRARKAAVALHSGSDDSESIGTRLLADIQAVMLEEHVFSTDLCRSLNTIEESPWGGWPLDARGLARKLKPYGIVPKQVRIGDVTRKGYALHQFADAFSRYLPEREQGKQGKHCR
jgi:hypothetical protein